MQHLHSVVAECETTMQRLRGLFTVCGVTMQHLLGLFTVSEMTMQALHSLFTVCNSDHTPEGASGKPFSAALLADKPVVSHLV